MMRLAAKGNQERSRSAILAHTEAFVLRYFYASRFRHAGAFGGVGAGARKGQWVFGVHVFLEMRLEKLGGNVCDVDAHARTRHTHK
jgi:hypothetical protein